jgi:hypothetical protein
MWTLLMGVIRGEGRSLMLGELVIVTSNARRITGSGIVVWRASGSGLMPTSAGRSDVFAMGVSMEMAVG